MLKCCLEDHWLERWACSRLSYMIGYFFQGLGHYRDAVKDLDTLLKLDPNNSAAIRERELLVQIQVGVALGVVIIIFTVCVYSLQMRDVLWSIYEYKFLNIFVQNYYIADRSYFFPPKSQSSPNTLSPSFVLFSF